MSSVAALFLFFAVQGSVQGAAPPPQLGERIAVAAIERTRHRVLYDPAYRRLDYPMGDAPSDRGVCSDLVVRSLRAVGLDLQQRIHEDMAAAFGAYPARWGLARPDPNIDHRRVPNIETYLTRRGDRLAASREARDYQPGDIVAWNLRDDGGYLAHIGIVTGDYAPSGRPLIAHNIGAGPQLEDVLFAWEITGRYRIRSLTN
ncbi:MAG: DUF1287 domain-containing protein [Pseudomonadota bacterium]